MADTPPKRRRPQQNTPARPSTLPIPKDMILRPPEELEREQREKRERREKNREHKPPERLGEYRVLRVLGEGAMGRVYEAEQESLGRRVALKVLPDDFSNDPQSVERFEREARAAAGMQHPNIVRVYGFGVQDKSYYYAMEHVVGSSLRQLMIDGEEPAPQRRVAKYMLQVALALDYAHGQGVIHRDVKPDNILIRDKDDQALVADFGLSRHERSRTITQVGALMGTPNYMAPEQTLGRKIDHRIDVYALGATFYECLTGELPFLHVELRQLLRMIKTEDPRPIRELRPDVDPDLEAICNKAMEKRPQDRYPTAQAMADDLIRYMRGDVALARQAKPWHVALRKARKHPAVVGLTAALAVVVLISAVWIRSVTRDPGNASVLVEQAHQLLADPLQRYRDDASRLEEARTQAGRQSEGGELLNRALLAFRGSEANLLEARDDEASVSDRALDLLDEALVVLPAQHPLARDARELSQELVRAQWRRAARRGDSELAAAYLRELSELGVGAEHAETVELSVTTDPANASVVLYRVEAEANGNWRLGEATSLGETPVVPGLRIPAGEYLIKIEAHARAPALLPVELSRLAGEKSRLHVLLPSLDRLPEGFVYVPGGEVYVGGDPLAVRPLFRTRELEWVDGFFMAKYEVTVREYLEFLQSLAADRREPHMRHTTQLRAEGGAVSPLPGTLLQPIAGVRLESARAYCRWRSGRDRREYRLAKDGEWEKAARGPAGRAFPWGDHFDLRSARPIAHLHLGPPDGPRQIAEVGTSLGDVSIYGIHDLGGNLSEWVQGSFGRSNRYGVLRGGNWTQGPEVVRSASREPVDLHDEADFRRVEVRVGFRLVCELD